MRFCGNLWKFYLRKTTWNGFQTLETSHVNCANCSHVVWSSLLLTMTLFACFQHADSKSGWSTIDGCTCFDNQGCQQGGETGTSSVQDGRGEEPYTGLPIRCCVNECGKLGYRKSAKVFSRKSIFKQFAKVFTRERNPLYGTIHLTNLYRLLPSPIYALCHCFLFSVFLFLTTEVQWHHTLIS